MAKKKSSIKRLMSRVRTGSRLSPADKSKLRGLLKRARAAKRRKAHK